MKKIIVLVLIAFLMALSPALAEERAPYVIELEILAGPTQASGVSDFYINYDRYGANAKNTLSMPRTKGKSQVYQIDNSAETLEGAVFSVYTKWSNVDDAVEWSGASPYYIWQDQIVSGTTKYHKVIKDADIPPMKFQKWYFVTGSGVTQFTTFEINMSTSD